MLEECLEQAKTLRIIEWHERHTLGLCAVAGDALGHQPVALEGPHAWPSCWDPAAGWGAPAPWLPAPHAASASSASRVRLAGWAAHAARRHRGDSTSTTCPVMQPLMDFTQTQLNYKVLQCLAQRWHCPVSAHAQQSGLHATW